MFTAALEAFVPTMSIQMVLLHLVLILVNLMRALHSQDELTWLFSECSLCLIIQSSLQHNKLWFCDTLKAGNSFSVFCPLCFSLHLLDYNMVLHRAYKHLFCFLEGKLHIGLLLHLLSSFH